MHHAQTQHPRWLRKSHLRRTHTEPMDHGLSMFVLLPAMSTQWDSLEPTCGKGQGIEESGAFGLGPERFTLQEVCRLSLHSRGILVLDVKWRQGAKQALSNEHKIQICSTAVFGRFRMG